MDPRRTGRMAPGCAGADAQGAAAGAVPEGASTARAALHHTRLPNGLDVLVLENHVVPLVTIEIDVHNGAYTESDAYDGLSHLYEHMFFKANERLPDQEHYLRRTRELGMEWNGTTGEERVNYYFTLQSRELEAGLRFMNDAIRTPLFLREELERERQVVIGEYDRAEADPHFHLYVAVGKALWHRHWTRKNVIGTREVILAATSEQMFHIQRRFYIPNNSALVLSGDVDPARAAALVESIFGDWRPGPDPFALDPVPEHPPLPGPATRIVELPVHAVTLLQAWHGPSTGTDPGGTHAADILSFILAQRNSRFYRRLVDGGLAASASLHYQSLRYTGPVQAQVITSAERFAAARQVLQEEIERLADPDAFDGEELETAKTQLEIERIFEAERPSQHGHTVGYWWAVAGLDYWRDYVPGLRRVSREDVQEFVRRYLIGRPSVTGVLVSPAERAALGDLREEGP